MNPGQSVKDRAALYIIRDAVDQRTLQPAARSSKARPATRHRPGAGRQRAGLQDRHRHSANAEPGEEGHAAAAGRRTGRSAGRPLQEPEQLREVLRAAWPRRSPSSEPGGAVWANQFDNVANRQGAYRDDREEIWMTEAGSMGSSRRSAPAERWAASRTASRPSARRSASRSPITGAALYSYYKTGELKAEGSSITEGIGQGRITKNIEGAVVDNAYLIPDTEASPHRLRPAAGGRPMPGRLDAASMSRARSGSRKRWARPHHRDLLCDSGTRYQSKLFNPGVPARRRTCRCPRGSPPGGPTRRPSFVDPEGRPMTELLFRDDAYLPSARPGARHQ